MYQFDSKVVHPTNSDKIFFAMKLQKNIQIPLKKIILLRFKYFHCHSCDDVFICYCMASSFQERAYSFYSLKTSCKSMLYTLPRKSTVRRCSFYFCKPEYPFMHSAYYTWAISRNLNNPPLYFFTSF